MRRITTTFAAVVLLPVTTMCQPPAQKTAQPAAVAVPMPAPSVTASAAPLSAQQTLDENDRIIAENQRMIGVLTGYSHTDAAKLDRLTTDCQKKLSDTLNGPGARRVFGCIQSSW